MGRYVTTTSANLEIATEIAKEYLAKAGYPFARLEKASHDNSKNYWQLVFNLGLHKQMLKKVTVDENTREVVAFG